MDIKLWKTFYCLAGNPLITAVYGVSYAEYKNATNIKKQKENKVK